MDNTTEKPERSLGFKVVIALSAIIVVPFLLFMLLMSGFIIFVPLGAFLIWIFQQHRKNKLKAKWKLGASLFIICLLFSGGMIWGMFRSTRRPDRYLIPQGYVGWVIVEYKVKGGPPLPIKDGHDLYKFSRDGRMQTSSPLEDGWASDEYFYVGPKGRQELKLTGWGEGGMIWGGSTSDGSIGIGNNEGTKTIYTPPTQTLFIGTEQQFQTAGAEPHSKQMQKIIESN